MADLITAEQMRNLETQEISAGRVTGEELMERAGQGVVDAIFARWPNLADIPGRVAVYCGPGNNGGDGYVVARLLHRLGWQVAVWSICDPHHLKGDARANWVKWTGILGRVSILDGKAERIFPRFWDEPPDLIIDAIFGTGLTRPLTWEIEQPISDIQMYKDRRMVQPPTVAIDVPSGLCADSGRNMGNRCFYDLTVTFHAAKPGHFLAEGPEICGSLSVVDIGLPQPKISAPVPATVIRQITNAQGVAKQAGHKFDHGHALVLTGGAGRTGAARLAARGTQRVGAGLVTLGVPPAAQFEVAAQITSAMLIRVGDDAALSEILNDRRINALCLGPGLGLNARATDLIGAALQGARATVLDADALTLLARDEGMRGKLHDACVLTPHAGEFARLFPDLADALTGTPQTGPAVSKVDVTRRAARRANCVVLFKGPDTVIAAPDGRAAIHAAVYERAAPWLATAGAGDVLAGLIAGLLARGLSPFEAACSAAWLHVQCALNFGPGLIAEDLPETLPTVLRDLGA
ncbi:NAD(P)H-hydrate dehydratase [Oceaniglobus ichthyenteri]|uniref:NAD(P)H-hydrate dehydratase n=1 Tax=Oceaniglobus ichthyenteri TaxID=2136177 RepID=UPI000D3530B1|nr:NAD(P)H-hydrate dehydratase [Oceaniglobus ichthyenteri]